jgi:hypothetical protein
VTAAALLASLRIRGVELAPDGDRLRCRAPRGVLTGADREALQQHKSELLDALRHPDPTEDPIAEIREQVGAVLIRSPKFGEVWLALDSGMAAELRAQEGCRSAPRPVLLAEDIAGPAGKPEGAVRAALDVTAVFPGARVLQ